MSGDDEPLLATDRENNPRELSRFEHRSSDTSQRLGHVNASSHNPEPTTQSRSQVFLKNFLLGNQVLVLVIGLCAMLLLSAGILLFLRTQIVLPREIPHISFTMYLSNYIEQASSSIQYKDQKMNMLLSAASLSILKRDFYVTTGTFFKQEHNHQDSSVYAIATAFEEMINFMNASDTQTYNGLVKEIYDNEFISVTIAENTDYKGQLWLAHAYIRGAEHFQDQSSEDSRKFAVQLTKTASDIIFNAYTALYDQYCTGGLYASYKSDKTAFKSADINLLFFITAAKLTFLKSVEPERGRWASEFADQTWSWLLRSGLIDPSSSLIWSVLNNSCVVVETTPTLIDQALFIEGSTLAAKLGFSNDNYGSNIIKKSIEKFSPKQEIVLEVNNCGNAAAEKGLFARSIRYFLDNSIYNSTSHNEFLNFLIENSKAAWSTIDSTGMFSISWRHEQNPLKSMLTHLSAVALFNAAQSSYEQICPRSSKYILMCGPYGVCVQGKCLCDRFYSGPACDRKVSLADHFYGKKMLLISNDNRLVCGLRPNYLGLSKIYKPLDCSFHILSASVNSSKSTMPALFLMRQNSYVHIEKNAVEYDLLKGSVTMKSTEDLIAFTGEKNSFYFTQGQEMIVPHTLSNLSYFRGIFNTNTC